MDASKLSFPSHSFDEAITIATTHHFTDQELVSVVAGTLSVVRGGGAFHIIDAVLPFSSNIAFKTFLLNLDRGRYPRQIEHLVELVSNAGRVATQDVLAGPLHDIAYIRVAAS
jgi:hypothetical protein